MYKFPNGNALTGGYMGGEGYGYTEEPMEEPSEPYRFSTPRISPEGPRRSACSSNWSSKSSTWRKIMIH